MIGRTGGVRFIVRLPNSWCVADAGAITEVAAAAEELGFWGVSVQDHFIQDGSVAPCGHPAGHGDDRNALDALQVLAYVAGQTKRVRLVASVIVLPMHNPFTLAKETAALDVLSGGRLVLGTGVGAQPVEQSAIVEGQSLGGLGGISRREFNTFGVTGHRGRFADESIRIIDALWTQERSTLHGETYSFDDLEVFPKPVQRPRPPIWVGGRSLGAQRRAARYGDGWIPSQCSVAAFDSGVQTVRSLAAKRGRAAPPDLGVCTFLSAAATDDAARATMMAGLLRRFDGPEALFAGTIAGSPRTVIDQITRYRQAGLNVIDAKLIPLELGPTLEQMRIIATEVIPAFA